MGLLNLLDLSSDAADDQRGVFLRDFFGVEGLFDRVGDFLGLSSEGTFCFFQMSLLLERKEVPVSFICLVSLARLFWNASRSAIVSCLSSLEVEWRRLTRIRLLQVPPCTPLARLAVL